MEGLARLQLCQFVSHALVGEYDRLNKDLRPLFRLIDEELALACKKADDFESFWAHYEEARKQGDVELPVASPSWAERPEEEQRLRMYIRLRACFHINRHYLYPQPIKSIIREAERLEFFASNDESDKKLGFLRAVEGRGNPDWQQRISVEEAVAVANELITSPGRKKYQVERRHKNPDPATWYPKVLLKDVGDQLGVSPDTVRRRLIEAEWPMPDSLVYRAK